MSYYSTMFFTMKILKNGNKTGWAVLDQIRTIDKQRVVKLLGELSHPEIKEIKSVISEIYVE